MLGTLKKIFAFAGNRKGLLKKSLFFSFLNGIFASFQFGALYFIVDALASDNHSLTSVWLALGMMMLSIAGRIFSSFFSMNEQTVVGYGMVADKRISIGDRLRYIPMGYFNKNNIGTITGIVTTTLGDVESSAPVAWCCLLPAGDRSSYSKIDFHSRKKAERTEGISRSCFGIHPRHGCGKILWF